ncbi:MAG TPA: asparagine synthase (glutamine-hydrolyzing) [Bacteroidaceae bacterium]|nr:asparagine synthase (glutamine-hydrolyzing) [Bacteroidaceae bacterium]
MCGISGVVDFRGSVDLKIIENMNQCLHHRGPDGAGTFLSRDKICAFGHVRLSIIDVEGSSQPLSNEDGSIWLTYNGEIYNYKELRALLIQKGHKFKTAGDSEVLVHLFEEFRYGMLQYLYGMFAFAIWDSNRRELFIARDRFGIKPVFYSSINNGLVFSSEQKGIFKHPEIKKTVSEEGIWHYLTFRSVPAPRTLYEHVYKLLPGQYLICGESGISVHKYWDIQLEEEILSSSNDGELIERTEAVLRKSIERRLISDVPLGAFLSGGVDSSLIVALMSKLTGAPVKTYTVGFENFAFSEAPYARVVADLYQTDHHELILKEEVFLDHLEKLTVLRDAPLSEPADIPLFLLSKMANEKVKVLLSGEGSDELFAGYPKYQFDFLHKYLKWCPERLMDSAIDNLPSKWRKAEVALKSIKIQDFPARWAQWFSPFTVEEKKNLFQAPSGGFPNPLDEYAKKYNLDSSLQSFLFSDCKVWLPDNLLDRGDRMTMGASIEGRVPFLDHDLVELAFRMPDRVKIKGRHRKWIIKQIALKYLPEQIVNRPKAGFVIPLPQWFRGKLREYCYDTICSTNAMPENLISIPHVRLILDRHCSGRKNYYLQIWTLLGLALWYRSCMQVDGSLK